MKLSSLLLYFVTGGVFTTLIVALEAYLAPKVGSQKAILAGLGVFFVLALVYIAVAGRLKLFQ